MTEYPECSKLVKYGDQKRWILEFLEHLECEGYHLGKYVERHNYSELVTTTEKKETLVHEFLGIDEKKLEQERRQIIDGLT